MNKNEQNRLVAWRLRVLRQADEVPRGVAQTCRHYGLSRKTFYGQFVVLARWRGTLHRPADRTLRCVHRDYGESQKFGDCLASRSGKAVLGILQNAWDLLARLTDMAGEDDASIAKRATNLARDAGAVVEEALAGPMQHLNILLLDGTLRYEAHARLSYCDANRLGVVAVFLFRRNGFTYCGLIMRRVWPKRSNSRAQ